MEENFDKKTMPSADADKHQGGENRRHDRHGHGKQNRRPQKNAKKDMPASDPSLGDTKSLQASAETNDERSGSKSNNDKNHRPKNNRQQRRQGNGKPSKQQRREKGDNSEKPENTEAAVTVEKTDIADKPAKSTKPTRSEKNENADLTEKQSQGTVSQSGKQKNRNSLNDRRNQAKEKTGQTTGKTGQTTGKTGQTGKENKFTDKTASDLYTTQDSGSSYLGGIYFDEHAESFAEKQTEYISQPGDFQIPDSEIIPVCMLPSVKAADNTDSDGQKNDEVLTEVVGIRFINSSKTYYFDPVGERFSEGEHAIVETARGIEYGEVSLENTFVPDNTIIKPLRAVSRRATEEDSKHDSENHIRETEAIAICNEKIVAHGLDMKLVDSKYTFDNSKLIFYFTSAGRVDFRDLVKDLAAVFRTRIELRQIGIRDEAKMLGGYGVCGRKLCCSGFLPNFAQVSIRMAKEQGLSLSSSKISGCCGRLMCCLRFEQESYEKEIKLTPPVDSIVDTVDGRGVVVECSPIAGTIKVKLTEKQENQSNPPKTYRRDDVKVIKRGEIHIEGDSDLGYTDELPE